MKRSLIEVFAHACALLASCVLSSAQAPTEFASEALRGRVKLLPVGPDDFGSPGVALFERGDKSNLSEDVRNVFARKDDGAWKTFADDIISFEIPDEPLLQVDVIHPEDREPIRIVGGAV